MPRLRLEILDLTQTSELLRLQSTLEAAPNYWKIVTGALPTKNCAQQTVDAKPPGPFKNKQILGFRIGEEQVGIVDLIRGFPSPEKAVIGLLLIKESYQRCGFGAEAFMITEKLVKSWDEIKVLRIGIVKENLNAFLFWEKMGFVKTGEVKPHEEGHVKSEVIVLEKLLYESGSAGA